MTAENTTTELPGAILRPRLESRESMRIAGLRGHYAFETLDDIPAQWARFVPHFGSIPGQVSQAAYGLCICAGPSGFDYISGVEVSGEATLPSDWVTLRLPAQKYAIFSHAGHVSTIREIAQRIGEEWLPSSGYEVAQGSPGQPNLIERYGSEFDPETGKGGIELWLPIKG